MYTQVDDKLFEGEFKNNHRHGNGKLMTGDGHKVIERGVWKNDLKS
jgi:MORN repeat